MVGVVDLVGVRGGSQYRPVACRVDATCKKSVKEQRVGRPNLRDASCERMGFEGLL